MSVAWKLTGGVHNATVWCAFGIGSLAPIVLFRRSSRKSNDLSRKERTCTLFYHRRFLRQIPGLGKAEDIQKTLFTITGRKPWHTLVEVEPISPKKLFDVIVVAPCTGTTLGRSAMGISDTAVTLACKAHLRNNRPVVVAIATNDGLGANLYNVATMLNRKFIYFVPFGQDDPKGKPRSLVARMELLCETIVSAFMGSKSNRLS